jgi:2-polyprenyl-3-methyl-5-hydroxy-6-metoxy-1,4-benzoquinol methylase
MKNCLVCNSNKWDPLYNNVLLRCVSCEFITISEDITPEQIEKIYTENYFKGEEYPDYLSDKAILQANFKRRLHHVYKYIDKNRMTNILEIGCAYGFFAEVLLMELQKSKYKGYDIVPEAIQYGSEQLKQNVVCEDYLKADNEEKITDVFMWDVIEHLQDPVSFIRKAASELETGGRLYITTGDIERLIPRMRKEKWRLIHPPSHMHYFSKRTLSKLLQDNGFKIANVSYPAIYRSIRSMYYSLFMLRKKRSSFIKKIYDFIPHKMYIALNTYDILFLIAEKK